MTSSVMEESFTPLANSLRKMLLAFLISLRVPITAAGISTTATSAREGSCTTATDTSDTSDRASRPMEVMTRFSASRAELAPFWRRMEMSAVWRAAK